MQCNKINRIYLLTIFFDPLHVMSKFHNKKPINKNFFISPKCRNVRKNVLLLFYTEKNGCGHLVEQNKPSYLGESSKAILL